MWSEETFVERHAVTVTVVGMVLLFAVLVLPRLQALVAGVRL